MTYKIVNGLVPSYLSDLFKSYVPPICVNAVLASSVFVCSVLFPGLYGGEKVVGLRSYEVGDNWSCSVSSWIHSLHLCFIIYIFVTVIVYTVIFFVDLFCTHDIYCKSVRPGRGIPPLLVLLRFLPFFFSLLKVLWGDILLIWFEGLRTEGAVCCIDCKAPWGKLWYWTIKKQMTELDLTFTFPLMEQIYFGVEEQSMLYISLLSFNLSWIFV